MRGSAYIKLKVWQVGRNGAIIKRSVGVAYGHSKVQEMSNSNQREFAYTSARNQALKQYRNEHNLDSDAEINYHVLASGILNVTKDNKGLTKRKYYKNRIKPSRKRALRKDAEFGYNYDMKGYTITEEQRQSMYATPKVENKKVQARKEMKNQ